ncbi:MAG: NAD(P)H-dependent flavin oxidoreductase [Nocardioidaceae bacterium]
MTAVITTWLTDRFGLDLPVVTAPMAGVSDGRFAAAATAAGVLGTFGVGSAASGEWIADQVAAARTTPPYGIGLMAWAQPGRPHQLEAVLAARPALVSISYGDCAPYVDVLHDAGTTVVTQVGTVAQALAAEKAGVDAVVARGGEGGGHGYNLVATLPLLQAVLDRARLPVLAAGGIATARGLAAVLAAGASGAWIGTAFACCRESMWPDDQVAQAYAADETSTGYSRVFDVASGVGWPADVGGRTVRNAFSDAWAGREASVSADPAAAAQFRAAPANRDFDTLPVYVGQGVGLLATGRPAIADVVSQFGGAASLLRQAAGAISG